MIPESADHAIDARNLTRRFGSFVAVDHITFDVRAGEVFGFLGANGAGKTTAIKMLVGLLAPSDGEARVAGFDIHTQRDQITQRTTTLLDTLGLASSGDELVGRLPLGWKQKLAFSVALLHEPKIVFLDEPTGGVDPITRRQFWELIYAAAERGTTVFVTTHYMDEAEYCDRISIMVDGKIAALGTPAELKQKFGADSVDDVFVRLARGATKGEAA